MFCKKNLKNYETNKSMHISTWIVVDYIEVDQQKQKYSDKILPNCT